MEIFGNRKYIEIPGDKVHELPPLLLKETKRGGIADVVNRAESMVEADWLMPDEAPLDEKAARALAQRKVGLAVSLAEQYVSFLTHWTWGESILEWIRQCETTFETRPNLRPLLQPDVWPHASRASFVVLLEDKRVPSGEINIANAMGYRLTFRQPPPIDFFSDKFLFFLNSSMASNAYQTWAGVGGEQLISLPPERFRFFVTGSEIREV